jgi:hypothetical protein
MIRGLWNHRVIAYAESTTRDEFGDVVQAWVAEDAPDGMNARPDQGWSGKLQDSGPGEQTAGVRRWFLHADIPATDRSILSVTEGPEAPVLLRVLSVVPQMRRAGPAHHTEVNVEVWNGSLT